MREEELGLLKQPLDCLVVIVFLKALLHGRNHKLMFPRFDFENYTFVSPVLWISSDNFLCFRFVFLFEKFIRSHVQKQ